MNYPEIASWNPIGFVFSDNNLKGCINKQSDFSSCEGYKNYSVTAGLVKLKQIITKIGLEPLKKPFIVCY